VVRNLATGEQAEVPMTEVVTFLEKALNMVSSP